MPTPHPRHLTSRPQHLASRPRHLPASRRPRPGGAGLAAFGLTTAALSPRPPCCPPTTTATPDTRPRAADRPGRAGTQARTDAHHRPAGDNHLDHPSAPTPDTVARASSRATGAPGTATTKAPGTTTITTAFSSVGYHHPAPGDRPTIMAAHHHGRADHHAGHHDQHPAHDQWADHDRRRADYNDGAGDPLTVGSQQTSGRRGGSVP
jgi:hypothetical protein